MQDLETACLNPDSTMLLDIGLALLKLVSSHRGLTYDIPFISQVILAPPDANQHRQA